MTKAQRVWLLPILGAVLLLIAVALAATGADDGILGVIIRATGLLAYVTSFLAIVSAPFVRPLVRYFGRSFVKTHHAASISALVLMVLHPVALAIRQGSLSVFVPATSSWRLFFLLGGRQALYLFLVAALAAVLRAAWKGAWRQIHWLNYLAFWFATVHGILIGSNLSGPVLRVVAIIMAAITVLVLARKRLPRRQRRATS